MKMHGVAAFESAFAELTEFDTLNLYLLKSLAEDHMTAKEVAGIRRE